MRAWSLDRLAAQANAKVLQADFIDWGLGEGLNLLTTSMTTMKPTPNLRSMFASISLCSLMLGCQAIAPQAAGEPSFGSMAQITSITPDPTRELRAGDKVQLKADVRYLLTADSGTLMLIVLAADNSTISQQVTPITRGMGTTTLQADFTVPRTTQIRVYTPLVYQDQDSSSTTDGRSFTVVPR